MIKRYLLKTNKKSLSVKHGAASLYVVIFSTLLLGVITLSYIRIIVNEVSRNSNTDLSQSAYDSALAGIEDAKTTLLKYHECLSSGSNATRTDNCRHIISTLQGTNGNGKLNKDDCDTVNAALYKGAGEVLIAEKRTGNNNNASTNLLQAYTCVTIAEELGDYRTTLNDGDRMALVPIRTSQINSINSIVIKWFSRSNGSSLNYMNATAPSAAQINTGMTLRPNNTSSSYSPPVLYAQLIQTDPTFTPNTDFIVNKNGSHTDRAEVFLYPISKASIDKVTEITTSSFANTADKVTDNSNNSDTGGGDSSRLRSVKCHSAWNKAGSDEYACTAVIGMPKPYNGDTRGDNTTFLRIGLPYGTPETDISVSLYSKSSGNVAKYLNGEDVNPGLINFQGVQAKIDSTGRANDMFRRVEARVELVDHYYPYPEFTIETTGSINKNYYITKNCWYADNGAIMIGCKNNNKNEE